MGGKSDEYLLATDGDELIAFYMSQDELPCLERDAAREPDLQKGKARVGAHGLERHTPLTLRYPVVPGPRLEIVVERVADTHGMGPYDAPGLVGDWLTLEVWVHGDPSSEHAGEVDAAIARLEETIQRKNETVGSGNAELRAQVARLVGGKQESLRRAHDGLDALIERVRTPLRKRTGADEHVVDFSVRREIKALARPEPRREQSLVVERENVLDVVKLITNTCLQFERTPKVFAKLAEEELRDIILGNLNGVFEGAATGETFSKLGKADIHLRIPADGQLLVAECKMWNGPKAYGEAIDQLFRYLTLRENHGIIVAFSKRTRFSDVVREARARAQSHESRLSGPEQPAKDTWFTTMHRFPDDPEKRVEVHHLLFNLHVHDPG